MNKHTFSPLLGHKMVRKKESRLLARERGGQINLHIKGVP